MFAGGIGNVFGGGPSPGLLQVETQLPSVEMVDSLTVRQLREELERFSIDFSGCVEKKELQERLHCHIIQVSHTCLCV